MVYGALRATSGAVYTAGRHSTMRGIIRSFATAGRAGLPVPLIVTLASPPSGKAAAGDAQSTLAHNARTVTFTHADLVSFDPKRTARVILSPKDVGAKLCGGETMSCASGVLLEGLPWISTAAGVSTTG